jgi:hypothetical protein
MQNAPPDRLFKYLPARFAPAVVERGDLLFRSLSYFRGLEHKGKGDILVYWFPVNKTAGGKSNGDIG